MGSFVLRFVSPSGFRIRSNGRRSLFTDERFRMNCRYQGSRVFACSKDLVSTSPSPWLVQPVVEDGDMFYKFCTFAEEEASKRFKKRSRDYCTDPDQMPPDKAQAVGSSHGWLASFDDNTNHVFLSNPITGRHMKLPSVTTLPEPEINLLDGRGSVSRLILTTSSPDHGECRAVIMFGPFKRLAYCVPADPATEWTPLGDAYYTVNYDDDDDDNEDIYDLTGISVNKYPRPYTDFVYSQRQKLLFCLRQDLSDFEGWNITDPLHPRKEWNLYCHDHYFSKTQRLMVDVWIPQHPWCSKQDSDDDYDGDEDDDAGYVNSHIRHKCWHLHYLVLAQNDDLFHVVRHVAPRLTPDGSAARRIFFLGKCNPDWDYRYPYKTVHFDVYKIDRAQQMLSYMVVEEDEDNEEGDSLEALAMFIGMNNSFAVSAADYPHLKPNSIYFTDESDLITPKWVASTKFGGHDNGVFDYTDKTFSSICDSYPSDYDKITRTVPPPMWFTPTP